MVIDDSLFARTEVKETVTAENREIVEASCVPDALDIVHEQKDISLFIVDYYMPDQNGLQFVEKLREIAEYKENPILMLTTESDDSLKTKAKSLGVTAWVTKPFDAEQLKNVVNLIFESIIKNKAAS